MDTIINALNKFVFIKAISLKINLDGLFMYHKYLEDVPFTGFYKKLYINIIYKQKDSNIRTNLYSVNAVISDTTKNSIEDLLKQKVLIWLLSLTDNDWVDILNENYIK